MSSRSKKDLASSCMFTFSDGRRCRTPRTGNHLHFCFDHAQKEARARAAETIGKDLAYKDGPKTETARPGRSGQQRYCTTRVIQVKVKNQGKRKKSQNPHT